MPCLEATLTRRWRAWHGVGRAGGAPRRELWCLLQLGSAQLSSCMFVLAALRCGVGARARLLSTSQRQHVPTDFWSRGKPNRSHTPPLFQPCILLMADMSHIFDQLRIRLMCYQKKSTFFFQIYKRHRRVLLSIILHCSNDPGSWKVMLIFT